MERGREPTGRRTGWLWLIGLLGLIGGIFAFGYWTAVQDPVVRRATVALADYPRGAAPLSVVLISDLHVVAPDMPPDRLAGIVAQINALHPDLVLVAGDLASERTLATRHFTYPEAVAPLAALRSRLGTFAVIGNHEQYRDPDAARAALRAIGVTVLDNDARQVGPLALGGLDDPFTGHDDQRRTVARMRALHGARVLLSHSPDPFPELPADIGLVLAGHTHCGQIRLPYFGAVVTQSRYGQRYACGWLIENGRNLVVTAGMGTSGVPMRIGAVPDLWVVTIGPR